MDEFSGVWTKTRLTTACLNVSKGVVFDMSDTEGADTDALLLIPPDLFLYDSSDSESPIVPRKNHHIKHLAQTAASLRNRLTHLENVSLTDSQIIPNDSVDFSTPKTFKNLTPKSLTLPRSKRRTPNRYISRSTDKRTAARKLNFPRTRKLFLSDTDSASDANSSYNMESFISNISDTSPKNLDGSILNEIDTFLSNVGRFQLTDLNMETNILPKHDAKLQNDAELDRILSKYINLESGSVINYPNQQQNFYKTDISDVKNENKPVKEADENGILEPPIVKTDIRSFDRDFIKPSPKNEENAPQMKVNDEVILPNQISDSVSENTLPSLVKLWSTSMESKIVENSIDLQKYEEEKLRRKHCETIIDQLQKSILEQQQKLAVAVKVDSAKDESILKLKRSLSDVTNDLNSSEQRNQEKNFKLESQLKISLYNNELLKKKLTETEEVLKVVHCKVEEAENRTKCIEEEFNIERRGFLKDMDDIKNIIKEKDSRLKELQDSSEITNRLNKQLSENMLLLQDNVEKLKLENLQLKQKFEELHTSYTNLEDELSIVKTDKVDLLTRMAEEKSRNSHLDNQKKNLQCALDSAYEKINVLENNFTSFKTNSEIKNNELKIYYQKQMDSIVIEKVEEFQKQLDAAKHLMLEEIQAKEKDIALQFARHLQKVEDRHQVDINLLKNKHKEEIKSHQNQLNKYKQSVRLLEEKLACNANKRSEMAAQIHNLMESQWQQTLKIITNIGSESSNPSNGVSAKSTTVEVQDDKSSSRQECHISKGNNNIKITDEQLQHYVKLRTPGISESSEVNDTQKTAANKCKDVKSAQKNFSDFEYPTSDRSPENGRKKSEKHSQTKRPWK